jgi:glycosyltransferase involved in cell wall biosynthesis
MKIGMLVYNDFVNDIRVHKEARDLARAAHTVLVVATRSHPDLPSRERRSGYEIARVPISPAWRMRMRRPIAEIVARRPGSVAGRLIDGARRHPLRRLWIAERNRAHYGRGAVEALRRFGPEVVHCHDLDTLDLGFRIGGAPVVYDSHELWRENNFLLKQPRHVQRRLREREAALIRKAAAVIITEEGRAEKLREWYPGVEPIVVMNRQDGDPTPRTEVLRRRLGLDPPRLILLYQGMIHRDRGVFVVLDALQRLPESFVYVAIGPGPDAPLLARRIERLGLAGRAFCLPPVPLDELPELTASADIGLSVFQNTSLSYYLSAPNKLFEYMRAGLPIVASDFPEVARLWEAGDLGERVDPADPSAVARAILALHGDADRRRRIAETARRLCRERFNWEGEARKLISLYADLDARITASRTR